jgi:hypothetical protein
VTGTITLKSALPDLCDTTPGVTAIKGPGAASLTVARSSDPGTAAFRIFRVDAGTRVNLSGLTITNGSVYQTGAEGGGIENDGNLAVSNSIIARNSAYRGGGILNNGSLTLTDCSISDNDSIGYNGGGGQGQRSLNSSTGNDLEKVVLIPTTTAAFHRDALAIAMLLQH